MQIACKKSCEIIENSNLDKEKSEEIQNLSYMAPSLDKIKIDFQANDNLRMIISKLKPDCESHFYSLLKQAELIKENPQKLSKWFCGIIFVAQGKVKLIKSCSNSKAQKYKEGEIIGLKQFFMNSYMSDWILTASSEKENSIIYVLESYKLEEMINKTPEYGLSIHNLISELYANSILPMANFAENVKQNNNLLSEVISGIEGIIDPNTGSLVKSYYELQPNLLVSTSKKQSELMNSIKSNMVPVTTVLNGIGDKQISPLQALPILSDQIKSNSPLKNEEKKQFALNLSKPYKSGFLNSKLEKIQPEKTTKPKNGKPELSKNDIILPVKTEKELNFDLAKQKAAIQTEFEKLQSEKIFIQSQYDELAIKLESFKTEKQEFIKKATEERELREQLETKKNKAALVKQINKSRTLLENHEFFNKHLRFGGQSQNLAKTVFFWGRNQIKR